MVVKKVRVCGFIMMLLSVLLITNSNAQVIFDSPKSPTFNYLTSQDLSLGYPTLNWSAPSFDPLYPDPTGYIIYRKYFDAQFPNSIYVAIDTVDNTVTSYTDNSKSFNDGRYTYAIASKGPTMPSQLTNSHSNIYLTSEYDSCNNRLNLKWQAYEGWGNRIKKYDVYVGNNSDWSSYSLYTSLSGTTNSAYISDIIENKDYYFYVEAIKDGEPPYSTKSNLHHKFTRMLPLVLTFSPNDNSTNVLPNENLSLTFSGKVKLGTSGNFTIYNSNETVFESIPYNDSRISISDNIVTINPSNVFIEGASYYVKIDPNVITNLNGDPYSGIEERDTWDFTVSVLNSTQDLTGCKYSVFPNPSNGVFIIKTENAKVEDICIFDVNGMRKMQINSLDFFLNPLDLSSFAKGIYFMRIKISGKYEVKKLIVQ